MGLHVKVANMEATKDPTALELLCRSNAAWNAGRQRDHRTPFPANTRVGKRLWARRGGHYDGGVCYYSVDCEGAHEGRIHGGCWVLGLAVRV